MPRAPRSTVAALVVSLTTVSVTVMAAVTAAAAPPLPPVTLMPGADEVSSTIITDDAVYTLAPAEGDETVIRGRSLSTTGTGWSLGPAQLIGRARSADVAASAGRVAYVRAADHRLVLDTLATAEDPDGTEVTPAWSLADGVVTDGVWGLSGPWITVGDASDQRLFNVDTGAEADLSSASLVPAGADGAPVVAVGVSDGVVVWSVWTTVDGLSYSGLYRATLAADGTIGATEVLDEDLATSADDPFAVLVPAPRQDGDATASFVAWSRFELADLLNFSHQLRWLTADSTIGSPHEMDVPADTALLGISDGEVAIGVRAGDDVTVSWYDLTGGVTSTTRTWVGPALVTGVAGPLVAFDDAGTSWLVDADNRELAADPPPLGPLARFSDVRPCEAFAGEILWLADRGIVGGYVDGGFRRIAPVNRDAMAAFLYRMVHDTADTPEACTVAPFADVPVSHPFCPQITWLAGTGITTGWPDGTFRPSEPVSREAMTAFLYRFANDGDTAPSCVRAPFSDVVVTHPFCGEIAWLAAEGLSSGWPDGTFRPGAGIERQAMAAFLFRFHRDGYVPADPPRGD